MLTLAHSARHTIVVVSIVRWASISRLDATCVSMLRVWAGLSTPPHLGSSSPAHSSEEDSAPASPGSEHRKQLHTKHLLASRLVRRVQVVSIALT